MSESVCPCRRAFALLLFAVAAGSCAIGGASAPPARAAAEHAPAAHAPTPEPARRTVVERDVGGGTRVLVVVTRWRDRAAASMEIVGPGRGDRTLVAEEVRIGDAHFVHLPDAAQVLGDDLWIRFDLADERHVRFLEANPTGLLDRADLDGSTSGPGVRVRRSAVTPAPPIEAPPADRVVDLADVDDLPGLALPLPR